MQTHRAGLTVDIVPEYAEDLLLRLTLAQIHTLNNRLGSPACFYSAPPAEGAIAPEWTPAGPDLEPLGANQAQPSRLAACKRRGLAADYGISSPSVCVAEEVRA